MGSIGSGSGELRFMLGVQKVRAATYLFAGGLAILFKLIGLLDTPYLAFFGAMAFAALSAAGLHFIYARRLDQRAYPRLRMASTASSNSPSVLGP